MRAFTLRYLCVQALERLVRLEQYVETSRATYYRSSAQVADTFRTHLERVRRALYDSINQVIANESVSDDPIVAARLVRGINQCCKGLDQLHLKLSYVPSAWTTPEIEVFIRGLCEDAAERLRAPASVSIVPSDNYTFEEMNLTQYLSAFGIAAEKGEETHPTLFLPKIETTNPLQWCSLVHEYAHTLKHYVPPLSTAEGIRHASDTVRETLSNWTEELFCDLVALHVLGPAYLASFCDLLIFTAPVDPLERETHTHPHPRFRVTALIEALESKNITADFGFALIESIARTSDLGQLSYLLFEERCELEQQSTRGTGLTISSSSGEPDDLGLEVSRYRHTVIEHLADFIPEPLRADSFSARRFAQLLQRLANGVPIGAINELSEQDARDRFAVAAERLERTVQHPSPSEIEVEADLTEMRSTVIEAPCSIAEILNAGWLYKWTQIVQPLIANLSALNPQREHEFRTALFRLDDTLRNSIETAYFGRELKRHLPP